MINYISRRLLNLKARIGIVHLGLAYEVTLSGRTWGPRQKLSRGLLCFYARRVTRSKQLYLVPNVPVASAFTTQSISFPSCFSFAYTRLLAW